ncbi:MAG: hypothetical protein JWM68_5801 [Verrucomicrobiales bacterium]|nr:hypothetical protein [Verrucomicrobiales bacterium]
MARSFDNLMKHFAAILFFVTLGILPGIAAEKDSPEPMMKRFIKAMYTEDKVTFNQCIVPYPGSAAFLTAMKVPDERKAEMEKGVANVTFHANEPFMCNGRPVKPDPAKGYPNGTKATYTADMGGGGMVLNCLKRTNEWRIDIRWSVESAAMQEKELAETTPEVIAKKFIYCQIAKDKEHLQELVAPKTELKPFLTHKGLPEGDMDQIISLIQEMVIVRPYPDESFVMPSGEIKKGPAISPDALFLLGMLGPCEVAIELKKIGGVWKVVPQDYFTALHKKNAL